MYHQSEGLTVRVNMAQWKVKGTICAESTDGFTGIMWRLPCRSCDLEDQVLFHGVMVFVLVLWCYGVMVLWCYGVMVLWWYDI